MIASRSTGRNDSGAAVSLQRLLSDRPLERRRPLVRLVVRELGGRRAYFHFLISSRMWLFTASAEMRLQRAWMLGSRSSDVGAREEPRSARILCLGQTACPLRQAAPRPALERRNRTFDQEAHRFFVAPLESFEELDRVGHPNWPVRQPVLLHRRVAWYPLLLAPTSWPWRSRLRGCSRPDFLPHLSKREVSGNRTQPWDCAVLMTWIALPKRPPIVPRRMPSIANASAQALWERCRSSEGPLAHRRGSGEGAERMLTRTTRVT